MLFVMDNTVLTGIDYAFSYDKIRNLIIMYFICLF